MGQTGKALWVIFLGVDLNVEVSRILLSFVCNNFMWCEAKIVLSRNIQLS